MSQTPNLPPGRAFLVRLDSEADPDRFCGRVEHLRSGRRACIANLSELQEFVARVLVDDARETKKETPTTPASTRTEEEES